MNQNNVIPEPKAIFRAATMVEADLLRSFLEGSGITVLHQPDVATGLFVAARAGRTIAVPEAEVETARELIAEHYGKPFTELDGILDPDSPRDFAFSHSPIPAKIARPLAIVVLIIALLLCIYMLWGFIDGMILAPK